MSASEPPAKPCPRCGTVLPPDAPGGVCPRCAFAGALESKAGDHDTQFLSLHDIPPPGQKVAYVGDYELLEVIARGGMGVVYRARQVSLNRVVALKMLLGGVHAGDDFKRRFRQEAEMAAKLQHPNIVPIYEVGEHEGQPYFSMEYVAGETLAQKVRARPLPAKEAAAYVRTVAEAVHYAHQQGVLHRDLKPSNILLGPDDRPRVSDFGLARQMDGDSSLTLSGEALGTPGYLPPEQVSVKHGTIGPASDVYGLGAVLYHLLTARPPFAAGTPHETMQQVLQTDPAPPRTLNPAIPCDLETICLKCLEKEPHHRYVTAQSLAEDVGRWLRGEPILAKPVPALERTAKWVRRHPAVSLLIATLALATLVSTALALWAQLQRKHALEAEEQARAVITFFQERVLSAARPEGQQGGLGYNVTLRAAISNAEPAIAGAFTNQPEVEASLRKVVGSTYLYLGDSTNAGVQFARALKLLQAKLGQSHPETLKVMNSLAMAYSRSGRLQEALPLFEESFQLMKVRFGAGSSNTLGAANQLATFYGDTGRLDEAMKLGEDTLQRARLNLGSKHPDTLRTMNSLANIYDTAAKFDESLKLREDSLLQRKAALGEEHPDTLIAMNGLANSYFRVGRYDGALKLYLETLNRQKAKLGADHPSTLNTMHNLANTYGVIGQSEEALKLREENFQLRKAKLGPDHPDTLKAMNNLAVSYRETKRFREAVNLDEEGLKLSTAKLGQDHPDTLLSMNNLAISYLLVDRKEDALKLRETTLQRTTTKLGSSHTDTLRAMHNLAISYVLAGRLAEARHLSDDCLHGFKAKLGEYHPTVFECMRGMSTAQREAGLKEESLKLSGQLLELKKLELTSTKKIRPPSSMAAKDRLDLSRVFDAGLGEPWQDSSAGGITLADLPDGEQNLGGVVFDIRGVVQLQGRTLVKERPEYPERTGSIPVARKAFRLHFLQGAGGLSQEGTTIARYLVRYSDGEQREVPVRYGREVLRWQQTKNQPEKALSGASIAWEGSQLRWAKDPNKCIRIYKMTWENPRPEVQIESLDFISAMEDAAPFLLAITVE